MYARKLKGLIKRDTYKGPVEQPVRPAPGMVAPAPVTPAPADDAAVEKTPPDESTPSDVIEDREMSDEPATPMVEAPAPTAPDVPVTTTDDEPVSTTASQTNVTMPTVDSSAQDALWRKRQEALSQPTQ